MSAEMIKHRFQEALTHHNRALAVEIALDGLNSERIDIQMLYEEILAPSLNQIASNSKEQEVAIWEEHVQSNIVRTVLENALPYVLKERSKNTLTQTRALIFCLEEEYHEIGARMTTDFLTILGFDALFIGANTPSSEIIQAIKHFKPQLVGCSLTNYYHLTKLHNLLDQIQKEIPEQSFKILVGGYAVFHSSNVRELIQADYFANTFEELKQVKEDIL